MAVDLNSQSDTSIGGDLVGRDKIEDKSIEVGSMSNITGAAIGAGATSTTNITNITYQTPPPAPRPDSAPPHPSLVIGREDDLRNLKTHLGLTGEKSLQVLTAIRGWPGIGKTTGSLLGSMWQ